MLGLNHWFALIGLLCWIALAGCSAEPAPQDEPTVENLQEIAQAYSTIINAQEGRPPKVFKQTLTHFHAGGLGRDPEVVLRSPRDGQPFVIITGTQFDTNGKGTILAYEQQGVDGKRYALMLSRDVLLLSDEEFAKARFAQGHKPDKS